MILFYKHISVDTNKIKCKKKLWNSEDFIFTPISYDSKPYILQTPPLFVPFGEQTYDNEEKHNKYVCVSFRENEPFIHTCLTPFYETIRDIYDTKNVDNFIKKNEYSEWMRFKVSDKCLHFNDMKENIDTIPSKVFCTFIIHLSGFWILNDKIFFQWKILQSKVHTPIELPEYAFIDDKPKEQPKKKIPPPPPLPPSPPLPPQEQNKYQKMLKLGVPTLAVAHKQKVDRIQASDLQNVVLKKCKVNDSKTKQSDDFRPSLDEIKIALKSLQKTK